MQNYTQLVSGVTTFGQLYGILNASLETLRTQFSGTAFPGNPTAGQACFRTDLSPARLYVYDGNSWADFSSFSPSVVALQNEVALSRGTAASLQARLGISINPDGTLKGNAPVGNWWAVETETVERVNDTSFSVVGDKTAIYTDKRALLITQGNLSLYGYTLGNSTYDSGTNKTTVQVAEVTISVSLSQVEYGQPPQNAPKVDTVGMATETTPGIVERATDAEAATGTDTTRYITPKQMKTSVDGINLSAYMKKTDITQSLVQNGYERMQSGRIIQWGLFTGVPVSTDTVRSFPFAFPASLFSCVVVPLTPNSMTYFTIRAASASSVTVRWERPAGSDPTASFFFIAIGN